MVPKHVVNMMPKSYILLVFDTYEIMNNDCISELNKPSRARPIKPIHEVGVIIVN